MTSGIHILRWAPRILCILAILFISLFAFDSFEPGLTLWQQISHFFIHLVPSFVLTIFLLVAWKWELIGGTIITILGLGFTPFVFSMNYQRNHSVAISLSIIALITIPFVVVGILFILSHYVRKKQAQVQPSDNPGN